MKTKICPKCNKEKDLSEFHKDKFKINGYKSRCKQCLKEDYIKNRDKILKQKREYYKEHKEEKKKYCKDNKLKIRKRTKEYRDNNKDYFKKYNHQYSIKNKEKEKKYNKEYYKIHRKQIIKQNIKYVIKKLNTNVNFRLLNNLRRRISLAMNGKDKALSTMFLIGCEIDYLMYHLQEHFTKGMSWDNYGRGGWEMDHIKPCSLFDLSKKSEQLKCLISKTFNPYGL